MDDSADEISLKDFDKNALISSACFALLFASSVT
jgi:hypothetical protein